MAVQFVTTDDGVAIAYEKHGTEGPVVVLIHGWSGSRQYWARCLPYLAKTCQVYALDLRHHGDSGRPGWGFHLARLAADLRDFLSAAGVAGGAATAVGSSMGAAVLWAHWELFQGAGLGRLVFVDQAPLQNRADDWALGSKGCYDGPTLAALRAALRSDMHAFAAGNAACCLSLPVPPATLEGLARETLRCDPVALGALMADHTALDWRPVLPRITLPCLNVYGATSGCFPAEGLEAVGAAIPGCATAVFERANHWLYIEQPEEFAALVAEFATAPASGLASQRRRVP